MLVARRFASANLSQSPFSLATERKFAVQRVRSTTQMDKWLLAKEVEGCSVAEGSALDCGLRLFGKVPTTEAVLFPSE